MPFFSIVIPTYNRADLIKKTIHTLLAQNVIDFEIIVVDDGSKDETERIVRSIQDRRLIYYKKENGERGAARNFGCQKANGTYVNFFDSDDLAYPNHLQEALNIIQTNNNPEIFHLNYDFKTPDGKFIRQGISDIKTANQELIFDNFLSCNGIFIKREVAIQFPFFEDRRMAVAEDWALWLQLAARYPIICSPKITSSIIMHDQRSIKEWNARKVIERDELLIDYLLSDEVFKKIYCKNINRFKADRYTFIMLLLSISNKRLEAFSYAKKAFIADKLVVFRKRFLASIKKLIF